MCITEYIAHVNYSVLAIIHDLWVNYSPHLLAVLSIFILFRSGYMVGINISWPIVNLLSHKCSYFYMEAPIIPLLAELLQVKTITSVLYIIPITRCSRALYFIYTLLVVQHYYYICPSYH